MAFSMEQIKNNKSYTNDFRKVFVWIKELNIDENVKQSLIIYIQKRLHITTKQISFEKYKYIIKDLLSKCCQKDYIDISYEDTVRNSLDIIFQLKWALQRHYGNRSTLYKNSIYLDKNEQFKKLTRIDANSMPKRLKSNRLSSVDIEEYFNNVRWI